MSSPGSSPRRGSAERRWASRFSSPVAMELRSIETVTLDSSGPPPVTSSPSTLVNRHGPSTPSGAVRRSRPPYGWVEVPAASDVAKYRRTGRGHQALLEQRNRHVPTLIAANTRGHHHSAAEAHQNAGSSRPDVTCSNVRPTVGFGARRSGSFGIPSRCQDAKHRPGACLFTSLRLTCLSFWGADVVRSRIEVHKSTSSRFPSSLDCSGRPFRAPVSCPRAGSRRATLPEPVARAVACR